MANTNAVVQLLIQARDQATAIVKKVANELRTLGGSAKSGVGQANAAGAASVSIFQRLTAIVISGAGAVVSFFSGFVGGARNAAREMGGIQGALTGLGQTIKGLSGAELFGGLIGLEAIRRLLDGAIRAANDLDASFRRLKGSADLAGAPVAFVNDVARKAQETFKLSAAEANRFAAEAVTLAGKAGDLNQAFPILVNFLNLAAKQGINFDDALELMAAGADGATKPLKQLFNLKAEELFKKYAESVGKNVGELDEYDKALALVQAAQQKNKGSLEDITKANESAAGQQRIFSVETEELAVKLGRDLQPALIAVLHFFEGVISVLNAVITLIEDLASVAYGAFAVVTAAATGQMAVMKAVLTGNFAEAKRQAAATAKEIKDIWTGVNAALDEQNATNNAPGAPSGHATPADVAAANAKLQAQHDQDRKNQKETGEELAKQLDLIEQRVKNDSVTKADLATMAKIHDLIIAKLKTIKGQTDERNKLEQDLEKIKTIQAALDEKKKKALDAEIQALQEKAKLGLFEQVDLDHQRALRERILKQLQAANLATKDRIDLTKQLNALDEINADLLKKQQEIRIQQGGGGNRTQGQGAPPVREEAGPLNTATGTLRPGAIGLAPPILQGTAGGPASGQNPTQVPEGTIREEQIRGFEQALAAGQNLVSALTQIRQLEDAVKKDSEDTALSDDKRAKAAQDLIRLKGIEKDIVTKSKGLSAELAASINEAAAGPLAQFFEDFLTGFTSLGDALHKFVSSFLSALAQVVARLIAIKLLEAALGTAAGGTGSGFLGKLFGFAEGGLVRGRGGPRDDKNLAMLSNNEYVIPADVVKTLGVPFFENLRQHGASGRPVALAQFADGGLVGGINLGSPVSTLGQANVRGLGSLANAAERTQATFDGRLDVGLEDGVVLRALRSRTGRKGLFRIMVEERETLRAITEK